MCEFVGSYEEALDVVRQFEETTNSKFLVVKRRVYESGRSNSFHVLCKLYWWGHHYQASTLCMCMRVYRLKLWFKLISCHGLRLD